MNKRQAPKTLKPLDRGMTIAYIGDGKGKTTAAVGTTVRAAGYGWKVLFFQFYKSPSWPSGERTALKKLGVDVMVRGEGFVGILGDKKERAVHKRAATRALAETKRLILSGVYQLVVLDEAISCLEQQLFAPRDLVSILDARAVHAKAKHIHILMTGHDRYPAVLKRCDLVSEMKMVKHPYYKGIIATKGIDF